SGLLLCGGRSIPVSLGGKGRQLLCSQRGSRRMATDSLVAGQSDKQGDQVVARKYRPQLFDQLVGQGHIAQGLTSAITTNRVGHAYLFTGARGTGKTSAARIFAKALNCIQGPTPAPC